MAWKVKCPVCGKSFESSNTGRIWCKPICECYDKTWCSNVDNYVCGNQTWISDDGDIVPCEECDQDDCNCIDVKYCTQEYGEYCGEGSRCCQHDCENCSVDHCNDCDYANGCNSDFYFHPIWHKNIHCPHCGSWDVDTTSDVWNFKCNSCEKEFSLKKKKDFNKSGDDLASKKIDVEKEKIKLLKDYKEMFDNGILTQDEFNRKKKELLEINKGKGDHEN